jgi:hypothetical protein
MKLEIGESLIYTWLKHVKDCHIVQLNWKASSTWTLKEEERIEELKSKAERVFQEKFGVAIFKQGKVRQLINQGETDVLGITFMKEGPFIYAVDVAFHEGGLNYKSKEDTIANVAKKCIRTAMCLIGYFDIPNGEIIFASPKTPPSWRTELIGAIDTINEIFLEQGLQYRVKLVCDDTFKKEILDPVLGISKQVADTSELFLRGIQMYKMFYPLQK